MIRGFSVTTSLDINSLPVAAIVDGWKVRQVHKCDDEGYERKDAQAQPPFVVGKVGNGIENANINLW